LLMRWLHTNTMHEFLEKQGWTFIRCVYRIDVFAFTDEEDVTKICRILVHPPLGIASDSRQVVTHITRQTRSILAEILRQVFIQLQTGTQIQIHTTKVGNILFAAQVRLVASTIYHLNQHVSTLIFKDQLVNGNMYAPEHHFMRRDATTMLVGSSARQSLSRDRAHEDGARKDIHFYQKMIDFLSFVSADDLNHATGSVYNILMIGIDGKPVKKGTFYRRKRSILEEGRFFRGKLLSTLTQYFHNMKRSAAYSTTNPEVNQFVQQFNVLIESLIATGEWFWIKDSRKPSSDKNDPAVGSIVPDTWNNRPSLPFSYDDGDHTSELRFLQRPERVVDDIVYHSLRQRFTQNASSHRGSAKYYPDYMIISLPCKKNSKGNNPKLVKINAWRCCSIIRRPIITIGTD
jgi:hypothetical protein